MKELTSYFVILSLLSTALVLVTSCSEAHDKTPRSHVIKYEHIPAFAEILEQEGTTGSILIYDPQKQTYYSNNFGRADSTFLPASTFKIPNSLIALETGIIDNSADSIKWDGQVRSTANWNQDLTFKEAFHYSCVPCYRSIARQVGLKSMNDYVARFNFGKMDITSSSIDLFWLEGNSRISQKQQIDFLMKFYYEELPISARTDSIAKEMMIADETEDYKIIAKSGLTMDNLGWYVGYVEKGDEVFFFASNLEPLAELDFRSREKVSLAALAFLKII